MSIRKLVLLSATLLAAPVLADDSGNTINTYLKLGYGQENIKLINAEGPYVTSTDVELKVPAGATETLHFKNVGMKQLKAGLAFDSETTGMHLDGELGYGDSINKPKIIEHAINYLGGVPQNSITLKTKGKSLSNVGGKVTVGYNIPASDNLVIMPLIGYQMNNKTVKYNINAQALNIGLQSKFKQKLRSPFIGAALKAKLSDNQMLNFRAEYHFVRNRLSSKKIEFLRSVVDNQSKEDNSKEYQYTVNEEDYSLKLKKTRGYVLSLGYQYQVNKNLGIDAGISYEQFSSKKSSSGVRTKNNARSVMLGASYIF